METSESNNSGTETAVKQTTLTETTGNLNNESQIFGTSVRGWITIFLVATVCFISTLPLLIVVIATLKGSLSAKEAIEITRDYVIKEPLYSVVIAVIGFYFGQMVKRV
jgi:hypothetical protein